MGSNSVNVKFEDEGGTEVLPVDGFAGQGLVLLCSDHRPHGLSEQSHLLSEF